MIDSLFLGFFGRCLRNFSLFGDRGGQSLEMGGFVVAGSFFVFGGFFGEGRAISLSGVSGVGNP